MLTESFLYTCSNVPTDFSWKFPNGFQVSPNTGHLTPKQTCRLTATFIPQSAIVYHTSAVCTFTADSASSLPLSGGMESSETQELTKSMTLNGIGKFPHVTVKYCSGKSKLVNKTSNSTQLSTSGGQRNESKVSSKAVKTLKSDCGEGVMGEECDMCEYDDGEGVIADFGNVAVGSVAKKWIEVTNVSSVSLDHPHTHIHMHSCTHIYTHTHTHMHTRRSQPHSPSLL